jgi:DNA polymerase III delta subunit
LTISSARQASSELAPKSPKLAVTPQALLAAAKSAQFPRLTLLVGAEEYLIRQTLASLLNVVATPEIREFDFTHLRGENTDGNTLWNALTTLPLLAAQRVIVLENPAKLDDRATERLTKFLTKPSATTTLLLVQIVEDKLAFDFPLDNVAVCEFATVQKSLNRSTWATNYVARFGKQLTREALDYLLSSSTDDVGDLAAKLDATILYAGDLPEVDMAMVMKVSGVTTTHTVWELEDAILKGKSGEALNIAKSFLDGGEKLIVLLGFHRRSLLLLWQLATLLRRNSGPELIAGVEKLMGRKSFKFNDFKARIRALGEPRIRELVSELLEVESVLKGRSGEDGAQRRYFEWLCHISESAVERQEPSRLRKSSLVSQ